MKLSILGIDIHLSKDIFTWEKFKQSLRISVYDLLMSTSMYIILRIFLLTALVVFVGPSTILKEADFISPLKESENFKRLFPHYYFLYFWPLVDLLVGYITVFFSLFKFKYRRHNIQFIYGYCPKFTDKNFIKHYIFSAFIGFLLSGSLFSTLGGIFLGHFFLHTGIYGVTITEKPKNSLETI
jgi:hypothetical protein